MPRKATFNFGANARPRKSRSKKTGRGRGGKGGKGNAWRKYAGGISNALIPE